MTVAFLRGLEKAPPFLVPIINPPFADNSPHLSSGPSPAKILNGHFGHARYEDLFFGKKKGSSGK